MVTGVAVDSAELVAGFAAADRLMAKLVVAAGEFARADLHECDGFGSMTNWLRTRCGMSSRHAHAYARIGRALTVLPVTAAAWVDGTLSGGQVDAIVGLLNAR